jgi:transglutaminase-like putative cysteine protease
LGLIAVGPQRAARVLGELLPTSGGTGGYDPFARGGINDGGHEVSGDNARSTGMTQTDSFLDSPLPSLYDMISDMYGKPFKPKDQERAIALNSNTKVRETRKRPADNLRPNREFATARKGPRKPRDPSDRAARAIFEVQGRTPVHVRATAFDVFDGMAWQEAPINLNVCLLDKEPNSFWMTRRGRQSPAIFAATEAHKIKVTQSTGKMVPAPAHLARFRVGRVDRPDFFAWGPDSILRMSGRKVPSGIVVETESHIVDVRLLAGTAFPTGLTDDRSCYAALPPKLCPEVVALAHRWAGEHEPGWPQISAILHRLRTEYVLDPNARVPEDCPDPLAHFLLHSRRGPDYQFATAAAVLLRVLGCSTRLMSGFYVSPDHYDPVTRHTPVVAEDLHFWAEVMLPSRDWLVVEATPGYEVLGPRLSLSERLWAAVVGVAGWAWQHGVQLALGASLFTGLVWWRRPLLDRVVFHWWRWFPGRTWQQCVRRALWLLEWRGNWAGRPRRASQTIPTWLRSALPPDGELAQLTAMAEWAAYADDLDAPWQGDEVKGVCCRVLSAWTLQRWRAVAACTLKGG